MRKFAAEFIGTFVLTFIACGAASFTGGYTGLLGVVGIALIFGLAVIAMAYSIGNISGCHINPAVSFGVLLSGRMSFYDFMGYVVAQMLGGIAAGFGLWGLTLTFNQDILNQYVSYGYDLTSLGTNGFGKGSGLVEINMWGALIVECILTFIFVITVLGVTAKEDNKKVAGIVIGLSLTLVHLFGIPLTGTSVNPARSFGPAFAKAVAGDVAPLSQVWVFIVGPLVGAALAAGVYMFLDPKKKELIITEEEELEKQIEEEIAEESEE